MRLKFASDFKIKRFNNKAIGEFVLLRANRFLYAAGQKKKDYLDYVISDTFVYICTAGELHHVCDEVAVLVKELGYQHDFEYLGNILKVTDNQRFN